MCFWNYFCFHEAVRTFFVSLHWRSTDTIERFRLHGDFHSCSSPIQVMYGSWAVVIRDPIFLLLSLRNCSIILYSLGTISIVDIFVSWTLTVFCFSNRHKQEPMVPNDLIHIQEVILRQCARSTHYLYFCQWLTNEIICNSTSLWDSKRNDFTL